MTFGLPEQDRKPARMVWDGTAGTAREMVDWARDAALLPYATATPPDRNAPEGSAAATWRLQIKTPVPAAHGGGDVWVNVPLGATVRFSGTEEEPTFTIHTARQHAEAFRTQGEST
jgi:hypothetical protein